MMFEYYFILFSEKNGKLETSAEYSSAQVSKSVKALMHAL